MVGDSGYSGGNGHVFKRRLELGEPFNHEMKKMERDGVVVLAEGK